MICGPRHKRKIKPQDLSAVYEPIGTLDDDVTKMCDVTARVKTPVRTPINMERLLGRRCRTPKGSNEYSGHREISADACSPMMSATTALSQFPGARMPSTGEKELAAPCAPLAPLPGWGQTLPKPTSSAQMDLPEILWTDDIHDDRSTRSTAYSTASSHPEYLDKYSLGKQSMDSLDKQSLDRHSLASTAKSTKSQLSRGLLRLAIYSNHGHLTVHVHQGRQFSSATKAKCSSCVKVSLLPDHEGTSSCYTSIVSESNNPKFDEKISYEISEEDQRKRLSVCVVEKSCSRSDNQEVILGAMSFGVRHLMNKKKTVDGWYYLLSQDVGQRKHLQCAGPTGPPSETSSHEANKDIASVNSDLKDMDCVSVMIEKAKSGYGFTVMGSSPVTVGRVQKGSTAQEAGLRRGDAIVRINGQNVSRSTADSVARMVRMASKHLMLQVYRAQCEDKENQPLGCNKENIPRPTPQSNPQSRLSSYDTPERHHISSAKKALGRLSASKHTLDSLPGYDSPMRDMHANFLSPGLLSNHCLSRHSSSKRTPSFKRKQSESQELPSRTMFLHDASVIQRCNPASPSCNYETLPLDLSAEDMDTASIQHEDSATDLDCAQTSLQNVTISFQDLTQGEQERQVAITELMEAELTFVTQMQQGIAYYSRPLRHCILAHSEHARLFQNVEKLVALSAFHVRQMESASVPWVEDAVEGKYVDAMGAVYQPKMRFLCEAYQQYMTGLQEAQRLYADLCHYQEFKDFMKKIPTDQNLISLEEFLEKPSSHATDMMIHLQTILALTEESHPDYNTLYMVVAAITNFCEKNQQHPKRSHKARSTASDISMTSRSSSQSRSSMRSMTSVMSVDSEVLEIQSRLLFPKDVHAFQIATSNRHLIYSGELMSVQDGKCWTRVNLLLFNDLLIQTQPEKGSYLSVVDNPVLLSDIVSADFSSAHPSEFMLTVEHPQSPHGHRYLSFRAFGIEQKCTWKSLLEQRIAACRSQKELMGSRRADGSF